MLVEDLLHKEDILVERNYHIIRTECSQFLEESGEIPLHKILPTTYNDIQKVKARFKKKTDEVSNYFNKAFETETSNLRQRAIFAYTTPPTITEDLDLFYVFPINQYKFLYSPEVTNSNSNYKQVIDTLFETFSDVNEATEIITDLLKYTYSAQNLYEGLSSSAEIIFYGIPYYYAVRVTPKITYKQIIK